MPAPVYRAKVVLVGEAAVGKSSLVQRFVKGTFHERMEPTIGAAFLTQKCRIRGGEEGDRWLKYEVWDTAGQERFHSLAPMYYRHAQVALVVYDLTDATSFERAKRWMVELKRQASPRLVVALCGNKLDLEAQRQVSVEEASTFATSEHILFYETSAKTGQHVQQLFTDIGRYLPLNECPPLSPTSPQQKGLSLDGAPLEKQDHRQQRPCTCG